jgi:hypothetical protein
MIKNNNLKKGRIVLNYRPLFILRNTKLLTVSAKNDITVISGISHGNGTISI